MSLSTFSQALDDTPDPWRLAVVGCGPRGMYCLDSLSRAMRESTMVDPLEVTIFEPTKSLGAGNIYDLAQPGFLRLNFAARHVDAWPTGALRTTEELSLCQWLALHFPLLADGNAFVPRQVVGQYLADCWRIVLARLEAVATVKVVHESVHAIARDSSQWTVATANQKFLADDVLLTTGHEGLRSGRTVNKQLASDATGGVFPVDRWISKKRINAKKTVAVRGFGLTWIDAALALTEGRGGKFVGQKHATSYLASGEEPSVILPYSRTGRPMLAKPACDALINAVDNDIWRRGRELIFATSQKTSQSCFASIWQCVLDAAATALASVEKSTSPGIELMGPAQWFRSWTTSKPSPTDVVRTMEQSVEVAFGTRQPDAGWAVGEAWRRLYPAIAQRLSHGGLTADDWPEFIRIATEMERVAFGPPPENLGRIVALIKSGLIDLSLLRGSRIKMCDGVAALHSNTEKRRVDYVVNAVIPSPYEPSAFGPVSTLLDQGVIARIHHRAGINVDPAGAPVTATVDGPRGLAILGRATEGCIVGNDSLSRKLHHHDREWARQLVARWATSRQTEATRE